MVGISFENYKFWGTIYMLDFTVYKFDGFFRNYGINGPQREKNIEKIKNYIKWNNQVHEPQM